MSNNVINPIMDEDELSIDNFDIEDDSPCDGDIDYKYLDDEENISAIKESNPYIKNMLQKSGLHIVVEAKAIKAYETQNVIGLFYMFIASSYLSHCIYKWTKDSLIESGILLILVFASSNNTLG